MSTDLIRQILDRQTVGDTVTRLFIETDRKNWPAVEAIFTDAVKFAMHGTRTPIEATLSGAEIAAMWHQGLEHVPTLHHQMGNLLIELHGDHAHAFCYATATHYQPEDSKPLTTFAGTYDFTLARTGDRWQIEGFRFNARYVI